LTESAPPIETSASRGSPTKARAFVAVIQVGDRGLADDSALGTQESWQPAYQQVSRDRRMHVGVWLRGSEDGKAGGARASSAGTLVLGSSAEWSGTRDDLCMAAGVAIRYDLDRTRLRVHTSIVGLPPVFLYQTPSRVVIASDLWLLKSVPGVRFDFDRQSVTDLCRIGYPIGFRTLFEGIRVVPGGSRLEVNAQGDVRITLAWTMPAAVPLESWHSYIDLQVEVFNETMRRVDREGSFLSLTAGLDTRTILAALLRAGLTVPAYTMSWKDVTLDARTAGALCRAYGLEHRVIRFDEGFAKELPGCALVASCLSGGLASIWQATEVAFYDRITTKYATRLSGYLGNQVGRGGVEQVSLRQGDPSILGAALTEAGTRYDANHGFDDDTRTEARLNPVRSMLHDVLFASIGNFCIGNHFMVQESPYSDRSMIETLGQAPREPKPRAASVPRMRLRQLRHNFIGEAEGRSFQRTLVKGVGGYVAECPVNWGWRVSGGMVAKEMGLGILAFLDMAAASRTLEGSIIGRALAALPSAGMHDFRQLRKWCSRDFVHDTLLARKLRESGVFDTDTIERMVGEHFAGRRDHHRSLMLALDLAHAYRIFVAGMHEGVVRHLRQSGAAIGV